MSGDKMTSPKIKELRESFNMDKFKDELAKQINEKIEKIAYLNGIIEGLLIAQSFTCLVTEVGGKYFIGECSVVRENIAKEIKNTIEKIEEAKKGGKK